MRNQTGHDSELDGVQKTNIKSPRKNPEQIPLDSESYVSSGERGKMTNRNLQQISKDIKIKQIPKGGTPIQLRELRELEGGSDEEGGMRTSKRLKSSEAKKEGPKDRSMHYVASETNLRDKAQVENKLNLEYSEAWEVNSTPILLLQLLIFVVVGALNGFLFFWISINVPMHLRDYIAAIIISLAVIFILLDVFIAIIATKIITSKGIQNMNALQVAISLGFIGLDRIKALDINS